MPIEPMKGLSGSWSVAGKGRVNKTLAQSDGSVLPLDRKESTRDQKMGNAMAERILLVDDESNLLDGFRRSLGRDFQLETALGGQQALKLVTEGDPYAVVVSDMRMPGMDGLQFLSRVKGLMPDTI